MTRSKRDDTERVVKRALRAVIYARVSSEIQESDGSSLDTQVEGCTAYANEQGYFIVETVRETFTGSLLWERKKLSRIREMARNNEFDVLIFNTFDRLSRNQTHLVIVLEEMQRLNIRVECVRENLDSTPQGELLRHVMG